MSVKKIVTIWVVLLLLTGCGTVHPKNVITATGTTGSHYVPHKKEGKTTAIVFIHGVLGDSKTTWTNNITEAYWPSLVAHDPHFSDANVYVFQYPTAHFTRNLSINELSECMRSRLEADGVLDHQKLVFVSHSMGGLITRSFLLKYRDQAPKVRFAYFLGTPTEGSPMASFASVFSSNPQFRNLYPLEADNYLADQLRDWLSAKLSIKSYCAYETKKTFGTLLVDMKSATNLCTEPVLPLSENHIDIVKPQDNASDTYIALKNAYKNSTEKLAGLSEFFRKDFPGTTKVTKEIQLQDDIGIKYDLHVTEYQDFEGKNKFLGFYVPASLKSYSICEFVPQAYKQLMSDLETDVEITGGHVADSAQTSSLNLVFSGRIYIYHEDSFTLQQKASLEQLFLSKGLSVVLRGRDYMLISRENVKR